MANVNSQLAPILEKLKATETYAEGKKQLEDLWNKVKTEGKKTASGVGRAIISGLAAQLAKKGLPLLAKLGTKAIAALNHPQWYADMDRTISGLISAFKPTTSADAGRQELICGLGVVPLNITNMIDLAILKDQIATAISAFDSMLGAASGLTYDQIVNVLKAGAKVVAALTIGKRFYDGRKAKLIANTPVYLQNGTDVTELKLEDLTASPTKVFIEGYRVYLYDISDSQETEQITSYKSRIMPEYPVISNAVWTTDVVSPSTNVFCPDKIYELINYLYSGYFTNGPEQGVNGLVMFIEAGLLDTSTAVNWKTYLTNCLDSYRTALSANPFLEQFMTQLGFGKPLLGKAADYNRWLAADTYNLYEDAGIIAALANYMTAGKYGTAGYDGRYKLTPDTIDVLDNSDDVDITFDPNNILITNVPLGHVGSLLKLWLMKEYADSPIFAVGVKRMISTSSPYKPVYQLIKQEDLQCVDKCQDMTATLATNITNLLVLGQDATADKTRVRKFVLFMNDKAYGINTQGMMANEIVGLIDSRDYEYSAYAEISGSDKVQVSPTITVKKIIIDGTDTFTVMNLGDVIKVMKTNITTHYNFSESYRKALELWNQTNNIAKF